MNTLDAAQPFALFEDNANTPARALLLHGPCEQRDLHANNDPFAWLNALESAQREGRWIALAADYELGYALEPHLRRYLPSPLDGNTRLARARLFEHAEWLSGEGLETWWQTQLGALSPQQREAGILSLQPHQHETAHAEAIQRAHTWIAAGDCYQVNVTFPFEGLAYGHPLALFHRLRSAQPVGFGALLGDTTRWILSRSPELFVHRQGNTLRCRPMKGTAPRDADPTRDAALADALQHSEKDRAENLMIVDLIRNDLGRLCPPGGVQVEALFALEHYASVHQLTSSVRAAPVQAGLGEIFRALFPCGSVTGAPKIRAMEILHDLESGPRGLYCGALGYLAPGGDFAFSVPIRTLVCENDDAHRGALRLDAGSGIVADSQAASEYAECLNKAAFATRLADEVQLIETIQWHPALQHPAPLLDAHLARLQTSAQALQRPCDIAAVQAALTQATTGLPHQAHRLRLRLAADGSIDISSHLLDPLPPSPTVALSSMPLDSHDPRLRHKTTARAFYDKALAGAIADGHFDLLYFNERDELCEGARSNVILEINGEMWTPPVSSGLLPGVMRGSLLERGVIRERVLHKADLQRASRVFVCNALRGMVEVNLAS